MGIVTFNEELHCPVSAKRMFHALFEDDHNLIPKIMPNVKSVDFISGDGSPGSINQVNFVDGHPVKFVKHRLDKRDAANYECNYTVIESDTFGDKVECVANEVKFEDAPDGGCICKIKSCVHPKGDAVLDEEHSKAGHGGYMAKYKAVTDYLVANPDVYA
ncbi:hypothetical protein MKX03_018396 [Papaver bracteatum]|nr:hypothetical protein MKX03_018396 [Papaver bracteatum]